MLTKWIALLGIVAMLAACSTTPAPHATSATVWDGGTWNSMLGYHGPANARVVNAPQ